MAAPCPAQHRLAFVDVGHLSGASTSPVRCDNNQDQRGMSYAIREVASGLGFIEGPVSLPDGNLVVTDVGAGTLVFVDVRSGRHSIFARTAGGANGLAVVPDGYFYLCNNGGLTFSKTAHGHNAFVPGTRGDNPIQPCIQRISPSGEVADLYTHCSGEPLAAPNDLVFDGHGGFYFTDSGHQHGRLCDLGGLYYGRADGSGIVEIIHDPNVHAPVTQPNGCGMSPVGKRLYVTESGPCRLWSWTVQGPGSLDLVGAEPGFNGASLVYDEPRHSIFDSLAVDSAGNICIGTLMTGGISVITPDGELDAFIEFPGGEPFPTNICFGGKDMRKAYVTASGNGKIFEIDWPQAGLPPHHWDRGKILL